MLQILSIILAYLLIALFFSLEFFLRKEKQARSLDAKESDNRSTVLIIATFFIVLVLSLIFNFLGIGSLLNIYFITIGLGLMILGIIIRIWSMRVLSQFYTRTLRTVEEHSLVRKGPYRFIRHPGYLGTVLVWSAAGLAMHNIIIFISAALLIVLAYVYRIRNEETMLVNQFNDQYRDYQKHSWRLLPFIW